MRNLRKYIRVLYVTIGSIIITSWTSNVLAGNTTSDNKQVTKISYPGLVNSSLAHANLIKQDGQVVRPLLDFLALFSIKHQGTLQSINAAMQENFIRQPGLERWDLADTEQDTKVRKSALSLLRNMYLVDSIPHFKVDVDYFLVFGGTLHRVEKRFRDFLTQYNAGMLQCKNIVFLASARKLQANELENIKNTLGRSFVNFLTDLDKKETELTEGDMVRYIWRTEATTNLKAKFQESKNLFFINSAFVNAIHSMQGINQRPTTLITIEDWIKGCIPTPGTCHANVEKPYGIRMEKSLRLALEKYSRQLVNLKKPFSITWNSPAAENDLLLAVYKDELARTFLQEYELKKYLGIVKE